MLKKLLCWKLCAILVLVVLLYNNNLLCMCKENIIIYSNIQLPDFWNKTFPSFLFPPVRTKLHFKILVYGIIKQVVLQKIYPNQINQKYRNISYNVNVSLDWTFLRLSVCVLQWKLTLHKPFTIQKENVVSTVK